MIHLSNRVSAWVSTTVVGEPEVRKRAMVVEFMIKISVALRELHNFNGLMEVLAGLQSSAVSRLKKTFEHVSPVLRKRLTDLQREMSSDRNYGEYRNLLRNLPPPCLPYLGLYL